MAFGVVLSTTYRRILVEDRLKFELLLVFPLLQGLPLIDDHLEPNVLHVFLLELLVFVDLLKSLQTLLGTIYY